MSGAGNDDFDRQIDAMLRRTYAPPPAEQIVAGTWPRERVRVRRAAAAVALAAAALVLAAVAFVLTRSERKGTDPAALPAMWVAAYHDAVARGFGEQPCCDGDCDLQTKCREMFAAALALDPDATVEVCGGYCGLPAGGAAAMLARADGEPVCVFVLPRAKAARIPDGDHGGLRIHRREVGALVAFEVSRLPGPRVLPRLYEPEG